MIKQLIAKAKAYIQKRKDLKKAAAYYKVLAAGGAFLSFIYEDINKYKSSLNREVRRRFEKQLADNGKLSEEMVLHYFTKVKAIQAAIEAEGKPRKIKNESQSPQS